MLIDGERFASSMAGDELEFRISKAGMPGQPGDGLMPEGVRCGLHAGRLGIVLDDLLHSPGCVPVFLRVWNR